MITGFSDLGFWVQKWPFCDANLFSKNVLLKPLFYSVLGGARFFGQVVKKRGNSGHPHKQANFD